MVRITPLPMTLIDIGIISPIPHRPCLCRGGAIIFDS